MARNCTVVSNQTGLVTSRGEADVVDLGWRGGGTAIRILTKREELLFRVVLAFPYASNTGLACTIWSSSDPPF